MGPSQAAKRDGRDTATRCAITEPSLDRPPIRPGTSGCEPLLSSCSSSWQWVRSSRASHCSSSRPAVSFSKSSRGNRPVAQADAPAAPSPEQVARYRAVVVAGHTGDAATVAAHRNDESATVRQAALAASHRLGLCSADELRAAFVDPDSAVRARAAELSVVVDGIDPTPLLTDPDPAVVEVACFACGEIDWALSSSAPVQQLGQIATGHEDPLCRESAAAALGAIGDPAGLEAVLAACQDRVTVRRRATLALAAFDSPRADEALHRALNDKDWQVRQAAEDLLEVGRVLDAPPDPDAYAD